MTPSPSPAPTETIVSQAPRRVLICLAFLALAVSGQYALEALAATPRLPLKQPLATLPLTIGDWIGRDIPVDPDIAKRSQADEYVNRVYEHRLQPNLRLSLWLNFSMTGLNMRHSPEICLPSTGWSKVESLCREQSIARAGQAPLKISQLGYSRQDAIQKMGYWYYIFGEGFIEHSFRQLPLANRSSHGRSTRGSGLTVEIFYREDHDPKEEALLDFAAKLIEHLEPILPDHRAEYFIP